MRPSSRRKSDRARTLVEGLLSMLLMLGRTSASEGLLPGAWLAVAVPSLSILLIMLCSLGLFEATSPTGPPGMCDVAGVCCGI